MEPWMMKLAWEKPLDSLDNLFAPTRFHVNPKWKEGGFTHAIMPAELPVSLGKFEVVEDIWCPRNRGVLLFPCGKVVVVQFKTEEEAADSAKEVSNG
jgi:hypothetical protein